MERRFTFDHAAKLYEEARPAYPDALFDHLVQEAGVAACDRVLEIGCGTGKATRGLASRGLRVLALDPGPKLIRVAREALSPFPRASFVETTFEAWPSEPSAFQLVVAAQSLHWVSPDVRFVKAAEALAPGGVLSVFGNVPVGLSPGGLAAAIQRIYAQLAPGLGGPPPESWYLPSGPVAELFAASGLFRPVTHMVYPWSQVYSTAAYGDRLLTLSNHRMLEPELRKRLIGEIAEAVAAQGGSVELQYETHLYMARCDIRGGPADA